MKNADIVAVLVVALAVSLMRGALPVRFAAPAARVDVLADRAEMVQRELVLRAEEAGRRSELVAREAERRAAELDRKLAQRGELLDRELQRKAVQAQRELERLHREIR